MKKKIRSLNYYCETKGINMVKLAKLCGVSSSQIYVLDRATKPTMSIDIVQRIYFGTKKHFKDPLRPYEYLTDVKEEVFKK